MIKLRLKLNNILVERLWFKLKTNQILLSKLPLTRRNNDRRQTQTWIPCWRKRHKSTFLCVLRLHYRVRTFSPAAEHLCLCRTAFCVEWARLQSKLFYSKSLNKTGSLSRQQLRWGDSLQVIGTAFVIQDIKSKINETEVMSTPIKCFNHSCVSLRLQNQVFDSFESWSQSTRVCRNLDAHTSSTHLPTDLKHQNGQFHCVM